MTLNPIAIAIANIFGRERLRHYSASWVGTWRYTRGFKVPNPGAKTFAEMCTPKPAETTK